ncbi:MAG: RHS repeat protein [Kiritimatiellae bacterium]|nr:RHS repeat protein [Kiritimatiellia bacterium]
MPAVRPRLASLRTADLDPVLLSYAGNYLTRIAQGASAEELKVQSETLDDRRRNLRSAQPKSKVEHTGRIAGRLLSDGAHAYAYGKRTGAVTLTDRAGRTAEFDFNAKTGVFGVTDFTGRKYTVYYFMRYDVAYLGKVRKVVDGRGRDVVSFRYDKATGRPVRVRDRLGNDRVFEYDGAGRLSSVLDENRHRIRFGWDAQGLASRTTAAGQVTDYVRDDYGLLKEVVSSQDGKADRTVKREYDKFDRPVKVVYGPGEVETFAYDAWGRLAKHTRGKKAETYAYDHFGRLAEKSEDGVTTSYAYDAWGLRTRRVTKDAAGIVSEETRTYDKFGRLAEIASSGKRVAYVYDRAGRVARQVVDGRAIAFEYTKYGRLAAKTLLGVDSKTAEVRYRYGKDGKIVARRANGVLQNYAYDPKGQLVAVTGEDGTVAERYVYDPAGNILEKEVGGRVTKYAYDGANQLVSSTDPDGKVTEYAYDAAGRLVKEGTKTYRYGYLDKVLSVIDGKERRTFTYHVDGQLATATRTGGLRSRATETGRAASPLAAAETETFLWDGLALIQRGSTSYVNEPHPNGGSPVLSSSGGVMFNDVLGTTLGTDGAGGYAATSLTSFGDPIPGGPRLSRPDAASPDALFTGKPHVDGLGYAFLFRNYRPGLGKWQTADPLGYPDGWNQLAYCENHSNMYFDFLGAFVCPCFDMNNCNEEGIPQLVWSARELLVGDGGGSEGGNFHVETRISRIATGYTRIDLLIRLDVSSANRFDRQFAVGDISRYSVHTDSLSDSFVEQAVYEAVEAHERAHASVFFSTFRAEFSDYLTKCNIDDPAYSLQTVRELVDQAFIFAWERCVEPSGAAANAATRAWFENSPYWKPAYDGRKGWFAWERVE